MAKRIINLNKDRGKTKKRRNPKQDTAIVTALDALETSTVEGFKTLDSGLIVPSRTYFPSLDEELMRLEDYKNEEFFSWTRYMRQQHKVLNMMSDYLHDAGKRTRVYYITEYIRSARGL